MIIVADSSPLIVLVKIEQIGILPALFGKIIIPPAVARELSSARRPKAVNSLVATPPAWLEITQPKVLQSLPRLDAGETEAISLAIELSADLLLIDEQMGIREATAHKLNAIGTIGVLERAAAKGLLDLEIAFGQIKKTDFWISHRLLGERLKFHRGRKPQ